MKKIKIRIDPESPQSNLSQAARICLNRALSMYLRTEGKVDFWIDENIGDSIDIICSLNRAIEHLLKLYLFRLDPIYIYPLPKKFEDYCSIKNVKIKSSNKITPTMGEIYPDTIKFNEAIARIEIVYPESDFDFSSFKKIHRLRNILEHCWDRNESFFEKVINTIPFTTIPCIKKFIQDVLKESINDYFDKVTLKKFNVLTDALARGYSLKFHNRFEKHKKIYAKNPLLCKQKFTMPESYKKLNQEETNVSCLVCNNDFMALWAMEADFDYADGESYIAGIYADVKCLYCDNCHFYIDGIDMIKYLPDGLEEKIYKNCVLNTEEDNYNDS